MIDFDDYEYREDGMFHQTEGLYSILQTKQGKLVEKNKETGEYSLNKDVLNEIRVNHRFKTDKIKQFIHFQTNQDPVIMPTREIGFEYMDFMTG